MKHIMLLITFQARLLFTRWHGFLIVLTIFISVLMYDQMQAQLPQTFYRISEPLFPMLSVFFFVPLVMREQYLRTLPLIIVTRVSLGSLFAVRLLMHCGFIAICIFILSLSVQAAERSRPQAPVFSEQNSSQQERLDHSQGSDDFANMLAVMLTLGAPSLFLGSIGTVTAHLSASSQTAYLVTFAIWMFNRVASNMAEHPVIRNIYLFIRSYDMQATQTLDSSDWLIPKIVQLGLGLIFLFLSYLLLRNSERLIYSS